MKEFLPTIPFFVFILAFIVFAFAAIMQPIFVWIICARLKRTNDILARIERKQPSAHRALG